MRETTAGRSTDGVSDLGHPGRMGSFRCEQCGHTLTLASEETLPPCPGCAGHSFTRSSLFAGGASEARAEAATPAEEERRELDRRAPRDLSDARASTSSTATTTWSTSCRWRASGRASGAASPPTCASTIPPSRAATR